MCMFNMNPIVAQIHIKQIHSSVSYQWPIYQIFNRHGCEWPRGYVALEVQFYIQISNSKRIADFHQCACTVSLLVTGHSVASAYRSRFTTCSSCFIMTLAQLVECLYECGRLWVHNSDRVIPKTLKMGVVIPVRQQALGPTATNRHLIS